MLYASNGADSGQQLVNWNGGSFVEDSIALYFFCVSVSLAKAKWLVKWADGQMGDVETSHKISGFDAVYLLNLLMPFSIACRSSTLAQITRALMLPNCCHADLTADVCFKMSYFSPQCHRLIFEALLIYKIP